MGTVFAVVSSLQDSVVFTLSCHALVSAKIHGPYECLPTCLKYISFLIFITNVMRTTHCHLCLFSDVKSLAFGRQLPRSRTEDI